ncbi:YwbE family protein [Deinococcus sp. 6GRE01]|uniref:YwbE family protein n=1 Tax=Deinococcus sp. 6GRE01 TaxID=2745873 RepID=UPI001E5EF888|nr:YwbE family protein [Deinococcus sp. 6GRE01]MCD0156336.1 YwbE family protein [Deinococcus sp. 6GRE01]
MVVPPLRSQIQPGVTVDIVQKQDQPTGRLMLTRSPSHPHGIKVRLTSGQVGRVQAVITPGE